MKKTANLPPAPAGVILAVGVRAFTQRLGTRWAAKKKRNTGHRKRLHPVERWPDGVLAFDCETDGTPAQRLLYGYYQTGWWRREQETGAPYVEVWEEGWFYADDLPTRDPDAFATIQRHYESTRAALPLTQQRRFHLYSRREFVDRVFYPVGYFGKALIVGFNLPFDLSRIAETWGRTRSYRRRSRRASAFSLRLTSLADNRPNPYRPHLLIEHIDRTRAMMQFGGAKQKEKRR